MVFIYERYRIDRKKSGLLFLKFGRDIVMSEELFEEKIEKAGQKMDARVPLSIAKCGGGLHIKLPPELVNIYALETGDEVLIQFKFVKYCNIREVPRLK